MPASEGRAGPSGPSYRGVLRRRPFLLLWLAQLVSQSGDYVFAVALLWLVLEVTGSLVAVTLVYGTTIVPTVVVGPLLGVYVDRWDRRRKLVLTNLGEAAAVAALAALVLTHAVDLEVVLAIVLGTGASLVRSATNALVPQVVDAPHLSAANGLLSISGSFSPGGCGTSATGWRSDRRAAQRLAFLRSGLPMNGIP
ncbi:MAG TPA: MFS transporter [Thermoplasmata archaeon]|nr:MFS transporter [Thermoplasmata archaeon]